MKQSCHSHAASLRLSPPAGRGRIALAIRVRGSLPKGDGNRFKNPSQVAQYVVVPESQDAMVVVGEPFVASSVATTVRMLTAVYLHNQTAFAAYEVHRVRSDRLLSDELVSIQSARSQTIPECPFRIRRRASQAPRTFSSKFISPAHGETPPHPSCFARRPLPASGERE
jgi:hypothetical protein